MKQKLQEPTTQAGLSLISLTSLIPVTPASWHPYIYALQALLGILLVIYNEYKESK